MRFTDYLSLATRSLRRSRLRSGLTIAAILIGATGVTIMLTFVTSVKNYVVNQFVQTGQINQILVSETPNLTYQPTGAGVSANGPQPGAEVLTSALEARIAAVPDVTAVSATLQGGGQTLQYLAFGGHKLTVNGVLAYQPDGVIEPTLVAGHDLTAANTANAILVPQGFADALGFKGSYTKLVGQTAELHTSAGYTGVGAALPDVLPPQNQCGPGNPNNGPGVVCGPTSGLPAVNLRAVVVGVVSSSSSQGGQFIFMPLSWAIAIFDQAQPRNEHVSCLAQHDCPNSGQPGQGQPGQGPGQGSPGPAQVVGGWSTQTTAQYLASQGGYQSFLVSVDRTGHIAMVANAIDRFGVSTATGLAALDRQKNSANIVGLILGALGMVALGIAALGVMNTMVMSVLQRTREIGVMRALGAERSTIRRLFTLEAAGLGFLGGVIGVAIGYVFVLVAKPIIASSVKSKTELSGANFSVPLWLVLVVIVGTTLIGFVSGLIPARRAARLDPVESLRYE